jgi:hypothetical protein
MSSDLSGSSISISTYNSTGCPTRRAGRKSGAEDPEYWYLHWSKSSSNKGARQPLTNASSRTPRHKTKMSPANPLRGQVVALYKGKSAVPSAPGPDFKPPFSHPPPSLCFSEPYLTCIVPMIDQYAGSPDRLGDTVQPRCSCTCIIQPIYIPTPS